MSLKSAGEKLQWFLTLANTAHDFKDSFTPKPKVETTPGKQEPSNEPQRMPGAFGLSLEDERIFDGVLCQLDVKDQLLITDFLSKKIKNFQRERFIEVIAGLEVTQGIPAKTDRKWDNQAKRNITITIPAVPGKDRRQEFLQKFADILKEQTTAAKAFDYVVGARTILKDSTSDTFKKEARKIRKERKERNAGNELPKKKPYKGFWATAISFERYERRKP